MEIFSWDDVINSKVRTFTDGCAGSALTVGGFDGPHRGHRALCSAVAAEARSRNLVPGLITFSTSPRSFKQGDEYEGDISSLRLRLKVLEQWGFAFAVVIDFSADFSKMEGTVFLRLLKDFCLMRFLGVGEGFRCGRNHQTGEKEIRTFAESAGFDCIFAASETEAGRRISSTEVRRCIRKGELKKAEILLGRPFELDCLQFDVKTEKDGQIALCPKVQPSPPLIPPAGVYRARVFAVLSGSEVYFDTDIHTDAFILRMEVPAVYKNCRFDRIGF